MNTVQIIQEELQSKNIKPSKMMKELGFSNGLFSQWKSGQQKPSVDKLQKIAEYLNVSLEYLLGKTNNPMQSNQLQDNNLDEMTQGLIDIFQKLSFKDKVSVLNYTINLEQSSHKQSNPLPYVARDLSGNSNHGNIYIDDDDVKKAETDDYSKYD